MLERKTQAETRQEDLKIHEMPLDEGIHFMTHKVHNIKQKNGRINRYDMLTGQYSANSVSPHADGFLEKNIEPGIAPVVIALLENGYFTYSSCAGHCLSDRRFVGIAFPHLIQKIRFLSQMKDLERYGIVFRELDSVINQKTSIGSAGVKTTPYGEAGQRYVSSSSEAHVFNIQFHCDSDQFFFVEMIILEGSDTCPWYQHPLKAMKISWTKLWQWDQLTAMVAKRCEGLIP